MSQITIEGRVKQLKLMHQLMTNANDEEIYMTWAALGVPDCPMEEDFIDIAEDDEAYNECFNLFVILVANEDFRW